MLDSIQKFFGDVTGADLVWAILIFVIGWVLSSVASRGTRALLQRLNWLTPPAVALTARVIKYSVLALAIGVSLSFLGAPLQPLLAATLIIVVIAGLALRGISENFAAGIVLQARRPVRVGDEVEVSQHRGVVEEMNGRSVVIRTSDGRVVHVPNANLLSEPLTNYSELTANRGEIEVRLRPGAQSRDDLCRRVRAASASVPSLPDGHDCDVQTIVDAAELLTLRVRFWFAPLDGTRATSAVVCAVSDALRDAEVEASVTSDIPEPPLTRPTSI